jgi:hypothetical protein
MRHVAGFPNSVGTRITVVALLRVQSSRRTSTEHMSTSAVSITLIQPAFYSAWRRRELQQQLRPRPSLGKKHFHHKIKLTVTRRFVRPMLTLSHVAISRAAIHLTFLLLAQSRHEVRDSDVRFRGQSGHPLGLDECLLMTLAV